VIAEDVVAALARGATVAQAIPATVAATATATTPVSSANAAKAVSGVSTGITGVYSDFELSDLAQAVARRQTAAKQAIPHYYLSVELNLSKLLQLRESLNPTPNKGAAGLSVMDFVVKAAALAVGQVCSKDLF
jgi:pyruvate dehydrogenase E2 component (dihydrolipoamide acetyltransferase)